MSTNINIAKLANIFRSRWMMIHDLTGTYKPAMTRNKEKLMDSMRGSRWMMVHELTETYKPAITRNKEKLMDTIREKAEAATKSELAKKMKVFKGFYTVEMAPPRLNELEKIKADLKLMDEFIKNKCYEMITVKQAWLLFLVCSEVFLWFFLGETIGKGHIVGYLV